jgi:hypothetical protein
VFVQQVIDISARRSTSARHEAASRGRVEKFLSAASDHVQAGDKDCEREASLTQEAFSPSICLHELTAGPAFGNAPRLGNATRCVVTIGTLLLSVW